MVNLTFPRSGVLVLDSNSLQALVPSTLISQVESLLDGHRIQDAVDLADQRKKKLQETIAVDEHEMDELRYVYQRIGFQCFTETLFEDAGRNFVNGDLDPRLLVSYYPELRGSLFSPNDTMDVFAGVAEHMPPEASVDAIIRNYSPHLAPNTRSAPPTAELRKILNMTAQDMLESFLRKCRTKRRVNGVDKRVNATVDTVLAKLYALGEKTRDLYALIQDPNDIVISEVEPVFQDTGQYHALCMIYKQHGDDAKLLETWAKLVESEWADDDIKDPLESMVNLLTEKRDRSLIQKWGVWITKRNPERGLQLLKLRDFGKRREKTEDDISLLQRIQEANPSAAALYLEYLVLQLGSSSSILHTQFALHCVDQLLNSLADESVSKLWRAKSASYASSKNESSFLSYFESTTPDSDHKRNRLKTVLFLQGSSAYVLEDIRQRLQGHQNILMLESAIIAGKLGNHRQALSILVHDMRDHVSAEAYCTLGGQVIPPKVAQSIAEKSGLQQWATALFALPKATGTKSRDTKPPPATRSHSAGKDSSKDLLRILLEVYISDETVSRNHAAKLLNSQAINLDIVDIISMVPPNWSLDLISPFISRTFRRTLHTCQEGQIIRMIGKGQNLEVKDRTWLVLREQGALIEEAAEDQDGGEEAIDEKDGLVEKLSMHLQAQDGADVRGGKQEVGWTLDESVR